MIANVLAALLSGNLVFASGGGDPYPSRPPPPTYVVNIAGTILQFDTNDGFHWRVRQVYESRLGKFPMPVANSEFRLDDNGVSGHAIYRDSNYQLEMFSSKDGSHSRTMDMFVYDFKKNKKRIYLQAPCSLTQNPIGA